MMENIKSSLNLTLKFILTKRIIIFYIILLLIQIPFALEWFDILPLLFLVIGLISNQFLNIEIMGINFSTLVYLVIPISLAFLILNILLVGSIINSVYTFNSYGKVDIFYSFKTAIKKFRKLILGSLLLLLLNFLILTPGLIYTDLRESSYKQSATDLQNLISTNELESIATPLIYSVMVLDILSKIWKPVIPVSSEVVDLCIINGLSCIPSILMNALLSSSFVLIISLVFIFLFQEILLTEQNFIGSIKKSFNYFKNNFVEISIVWLISAFIFTLVNTLISFFGYLIPIIPSYLGHVFSFLLVIIFQTSYYLNFIKKQGPPNNSKSF